MNTSLEHMSLEDRASLRPALLFAPIVLLGFGLAYSLAGAGLGRLAFPHQATGSLVERGGHVVGSVLVAQPFDADRYFQSRPSAANYDPMAAAGSNAARSNPDLQKRVRDAVVAVAKRERIAPSQVPDDLVTQSGSGTDPDLSPAAIDVQVARVAHARGLEPAQVQALVAAHVQGPQLGLLGQPRVNVLELNLALDALPAK
jgi:K+-transporting ATPase ATPase C chain